MAIYVSASKNETLSESTQTLKEIMLARQTELTGAFRKPGKMFLNNHIL